jgi:ferredoxin--NADP+ reductase
MSRWERGTVVGNRRWTEGLHSLRIEAPVDPFIAGQLTRLALDIDGERVARPYSYVNAPHESVLEFYFNRVPGGRLSNRLSCLCAGDTLWVAPRAGGRLTLAQVPEAEHLWLLSTGTAIGPFLSILKSEEPWSRFAKVVLVHGVRTAADLAYQDTILSFFDRNACQFAMIPFVSREDTDFAIKGRIPDAIANGTLEDRVGITLNTSQSQVMICGSQAMVRDTEQALELRGLKRSQRGEPGHIRTESYW